MSFSKPEDDVMGTCERYGRRGAHPSSSTFEDMPLVFFRGKWVHPLSKEQMIDEEQGYVTRKKYRDFDEYLSQVGYQ